MEDNVSSIVALITPLVKALKMPKSIIDEMATEISESSPQSARLLYEIIGERIAKTKKSSVLKATEICDKLYEQLEENDLINGNATKLRPKDSGPSVDEQKRAYEKHIQSLNEQKNKLPPMRRIHRKDPNRSTEFNVENCELIVGGKQLCENTKIQFNYGHKYGIIGRNGIGKTQLFGALARLEFDKMPKHLQILLVEQEIIGDDTTVIQAVLQTDIEREELLKKDKELSGKTDLDSQDDHVEVMRQLEEIDAFAAPAKAAVILRGLGFSHEMQQMTTASLSGGWRMRVSLARALFVEPDILLLDEPTNHLDLDAVIWLEDYIQSTPNTVVMVSHDRGFLNTVCTDTIHFFEKQLHYYKGNYDQFEITRDENNKSQEKQWQKQQDEIKKDEALIAKFRANASRSSMAQCRIKKLEKMEMVEKVIVDKQIEFNFPEPDILPPPLIKIEDGEFGYSQDKILYKDIQFGIDMDSRIALVGANGAGKSTLINILLGKLSLTSGQSQISNRCRVATFTQHHMDQLDLVLNPLQQLSTLFPNMTEEKYRGHLGQFGITGPMQEKQMYLLSGGQKSRISFAICVWNHPHILILDEPTNHLDLDAVNALINAIKRYKGGVLLVSHDQHLITTACDQIWFIKDKKLTKFPGDFHKYRQCLVNGKL